MTRRLPDFVIGGAPRCGTTWLASALGNHPGLWLARPLRPEPKFFLVDEEYERGLDYYSERWFAEAPADRVAGEKSTNYLESPVAAERIGRDLPGVRLLFVLREPAARALSNYQWSVQNGMESETFATALDLEPQREAALEPRLRYARPHAYFARGLYAQLLRPYLAVVPREHVLVLRFEDLVSRPGPTVARAHSFLGVTPRPDLAGGTSGVNASDTPDQPAGDEVAVTLAGLREAYRPFNQELFELVGPEFEPWTEEEPQDD